MRWIATFITCSVFMAVSISGCTSTGTESGQAPSSKGSVVCEVFYRPGAGLGLAADSQITFSRGNEQKEHEFETMSFQASFQDDEYEGRALSMAVTDLESGRELSRQLYQFDPQNPVENQFIGGHGFTGLNYVFQPDSTAEMQYFCSLK